MKHSEINWPKFIDLALKSTSIPYIFGSETNLKDPDITHIKAWDCSEAMEWLFAQIGISIPDGSYNQAKMCRKVELMDIVIGDLLFLQNPDNHVIHHVGVHIGENRVLEAKGHAWGTVITPVAKFTNTNQFAFAGRLKMIEDA